MTQRKNTESTLPKQSTSSDEKLTPVDFQPIQDTTKGSNVSFKPLRSTVTIGLLISALAIFFLLTAKSVVISVAPPVAQLNIEGGFSFPLADHYLVRPGDYTIKASADGYIDLKHLFTIDKDDHTIIKLSMEKKPGHLYLTAHPEGSEILIDGELIGISPFAITPLSSGPHLLDIKAPRHITKTVTIEIEGLDRQQTLHVNLQPDWGHIELNSSPQGATIQVSGKTVGKTPFSVSILSSGEVVTITYPGYKPWSKKLSINAGGTLKMPEIELVPTDGIVDLNTIPPGATITINGEYRGNTPNTVYIDADKKHSISVFLNGYLTQKHFVSLESGKRKNLSLALIPSIGAIRVLASPKDSTIWIDGKLLGIAGETLQLPSRSHLMEIKKSGYVSYKQVVTPQPQLEQIIKVQLLTKEEHYWASIPVEITSPGGQILKLFKPEDTFTMGAPRQEVGRRANEVLRKVKITRPFYLATKEVTNDQYLQYKQHSSGHAGGKTLDRPKQPVVNISWEQAALYCNWLSRKEGLLPFYAENSNKITGSNINTTGYRLPTEAEWAWAARSSGTGNQSENLHNNFPPKDKSGNFADISAANILESVIPLYSDGHPTTATVGSFSANKKGLYDLDGNVAEWVNDYYGIRFNLGSAAEIDPMGSNEGELRVIRGASWRHSDITQLRLSFRDTGNSARDDVGFRIARYIEPANKKQGQDDQQ
ncbi:MAG: PEGA domain-containing protein [Porticoccus sp.]|jgi:formylglycine-generating enzyme required for sulfatase activity